MELKLKQAQYGVLLVNLGTPDAPTAKAVRRYLKEFLSDRRVVDLNRLLWWPLLNGIILPLRSPKVAKAYQQIWQEDSPLREMSYRQVDKLKARLSDEHGLSCPVELGMTYGNPSVASALDKLQQQGCQRIVVVPLFPQYSATTTASVSDAINRKLAQIRHLPEIRMVHSYYDHPQYIQALADSIRCHWQKSGQPQKLLLSFHGIPQRYADEGDPYPQHCEGTAKVVAKALGLSDSEWLLTYQSRFGKEPWLQPYTDESLKSLAEQGVVSVQVICPAFAADCLETLEEISVESRDIYLAAGGVHYSYIPALNDSSHHIKLLTSLVAEQLQGW